MADISQDITTTAVFEGDLENGATFSGSIETFNDRDWIKVTLEAGRTYRFYGATENYLGGTDGYLTLYDAAGVYVTAADDYGSSLNPLLSFTTGATGGTYYLEAVDLGGSPGSYSIVASAQTATDSQTNFNSGNNTVSGTAAGQRLLGSSGNDVIDVALGQDAFGEQGNDTIYGNASANFLSGGIGNDRINANGGNDLIYGDAGIDVLTGDAGEDTLYGGSGTDNMFGGPENDKMYGGSSNDYLSGGAGNDTMDGGSSDDIMDGEANNDTMRGGTGNDLMRGGSENDTMFGDAGIDVLIGGAGRDIMTGGSSADRFTFSAITDTGVTSTTYDQILDFVHGSDKIYLAEIDAKSTAANNQAFALLAKGTSSSAVAEGKIGWYQVNASGTANDYTFLRLNVDGDATIEGIIRLKGLVNLTASDFIL